MTTEQMDRMDEGRYLRDHRTYEPQHGCALPQKSAARDVWLCGVCHRAYIWSDNAGYGFAWRRVWFRYWWFRGFQR